ncbi:MAG: head GIN domain-containing protein [Bacteroidia bacterium]
MKTFKKYASLGVFLLFTQAIMAFTVADSITETKNVTAFTTLKINGNFNIVFTQGICSLKITAPDKDLMSSVDVKNSGATLGINMKEGVQGAATLYIGLKDIQQITLSINGTVSSSNTINTDNLSLNIAGNALVVLTLDIKMLNYISNSEKPTILNGKVKKCTFKDSGQGNINASELKTDDMTLEDSSDGDLKVYAHPELHIKLTGSGTITYFGNPETKTFKAEGAASEQQIVESK